VKITRLGGRQAVKITRREFIAGGGALVVSFALPAPLFAQGLPGALQKTPMLDAWIRVAADGRITVFTGKAELGQGIKTALLQIAAEQLALEPGRIELVTADTARTPNEGYTAGSNSMKDSGTAILHAAAQTRQILVAEAARRLGAPPERLAAQNGEVRAEDGRRIGYGALVAGQTLHVRAEPHSKLVDPAAHKVIGKPLPRVDIPGKVTGGRELRPGSAPARHGPRTRGTSAKLRRAAEIRRACRGRENAGRAEDPARRQLSRRCRHA